VAVATEREREPEREREADQERKVGEKVDDYDHDHDHDHDHAEDSAVNGGERQEDASAPAVKARTSAPERAVKLSASEMLIAADEARRDRDHEGARERYLALADAYPKSREAGIGRVSLGKLELDQFDRPEAALRQFDAYLRHAPAGNLVEEVTWLRSRCFRALGNGARERETLEHLLEKHPGTPNTARARQRLDELAGE
jgi:TolA-binding protein